MSNQFPREIYVSQDRDEFNVFKSVNDLDDEATIAIYELVAVKRIKITRQLV